MAMLAGTATPERLLEREADTDLVALNLSAALLGEEILALPTPAIARRAADLLWDGELELPPMFLAEVGRGRRLALAPLLLVPAPLALLREAWRPLEIRLRQALGEAPRLEDGRSRFEALRDVLLDRPRPAAGAGAGLRAPGPRGEAVRAAAAAARRLLSRVAALNRALLRPVLAAEPEPGRGVPAWPLREGLLEALAHALPALAEPDFGRLALAMEDRAPGAERPGLEAIFRHRALVGRSAGAPAAGVCP